METRRNIVKLGNTRNITQYIIIEQTLNFANLQKLQNHAMNPNEFDIHTCDNGLRGLFLEIPKMTFRKFRFEEKWSNITNRTCRKYTKNKKYRT